MVIGIRDKQPESICTATNIFLVVNMIWFSYTDKLYIKRMKSMRNWLKSSPPAFFLNKRKTKMTWHFVISAVWASTVFGPRLWPLSVRRHSLAAISDIRNTNTYMTLLFANFWKSWIFSMGITTNTGQVCCFQTFGLE